MSKSCVVIGGGPGGLFTGALLAHNGYKVTVLEKNAVAGGGLQCFHRGSTYFDTGMHIAGGLLENGQLQQLCRYLGIFAQLHLRPVDAMIGNEIHVISENNVYTMPQGREPFTQYLISLFPDEQEGIRNYVAALYHITGEEPLFRLQAETDQDVHSEMFYWSANHLVSHFLSNPKLKALVAYNAPLFDCRGEHTPAYVLALITVSFLDGMCMFEGGSQQLANRLADVICQHEGCVCVNTKVTHLEIKDNVIDYVETQDGQHHKADSYVSAIHPIGLLSLTDSHLFTTSFRRRMAEAGESSSCMKLFLRLKPKMIPYRNHPVYVYRDMQECGLNDNKPEQWPQALMFITPPSLNQGEWASSLEALSLMPYGWVKEWESSTSGHRPDSYYQWKAMYGRRLLSLLQESFPALSQAVEYMDVASPLTFRDYYGNREGAMYGLMKDCEYPMSAQLSVNTKIRNLFLTGQNVNLHGLCGVSLTAIATAEAIMGRGEITKYLKSDAQCRR